MLLPASFFVARTVAAVTVAAAAAVAVVDSGPFVALQLGRAKTTAAWWPAMDLARSATDKWETFLSRCLCSANKTKQGFSFFFFAQII